MTLQPSRRRLLLALVALAPASCSLLPSGGPAPRIYTLTPAADFPAAGNRRVPWQLLVDVPTATSALDTERIALSRSATTVDYFAGAVWTDRAPVLVQSLLVESFENSGRITAIARESLALRADYILRPELRHFEAVYGGSAAPMVKVAIGIKLVKMPDRSITAQRSFEATVAAPENQVPAIVDAFDQALHQVMRDIVEWTLSAGR